MRLVLKITYRYLNNLEIDRVCICNTHRNRVAYVYSTMFAMYVSVMINHLGLRKATIIAKRMYFKGQEEISIF